MMEYEIEKYQNLVILLKLVKQLIIKLRMIQQMKKKHKQLTFNK